MVAIVSTLAVLGAADKANCDADKNYCIALLHQRSYFIVDDIRYRSNITEDRVGIPLGVNLAFQVTNTCAPVEGLIVHLWSADALGVYSGFRDFHGDTHNERTSRTSGH